MAAEDFVSVTVQISATSADSACRVRWLRYSHSGRILFLPVLSLESEHIGNTYSYKLQLRKHHLLLQRLQPGPLVEQLPGLLELGRLGVVLPLQLHL